VPIAMVLRGLMEVEVRLLSFISMVDGIRMRFNLSLLYQS